MAKWWETAVFYQIYPRSFKDSGDDGIGDLPGIESKLDYLKTLGVTALWISPFYPSPMKDFGYDISDYRGVHPMFGDQADLDRLLAAAKSRGIRVIIDLVINHTSDEHPWFVEARKSRDNPKHDWYIWRPAERGFLGLRKKPNNWLAQFELRSAWWYNEATDEFYLGTFTRNQPELNWRNPELRAAMYELISWWLQRGVDGFRMDVVNWFVKDARFRSNPHNLNANPDMFQSHVHDRNQIETHEICRDIRRIADSFSGDRVLVGEIFCRDPVQAASYHGASQDELHMAFNFHLVYRPWSARELRNSIKLWYSSLPEGAWPNFTLSNHDQPRHSFRFRGRDEAETDARLRVAAALLLTLRGTPFVYYGEEIGMRQGNLRRADLRDPLGIKTWPLKSLGRDGERTPMQWDGSPGAGFTGGTPWLPINGDYAARNAAAQAADPASMLNWYRSLLVLRSTFPALSEGEIEFLDGDDKRVISYVRRLAEPRRGAAILVVLNLSERRAKLPERAARAIRGSAVELGTRWAQASVFGLQYDGDLAPYEAVVARLT